MWHIEDMVVGSIILCLLIHIGKLLYRLSKKDKLIGGE